MFSAVLYDPEKIQGKLTFKGVAYQPLLFLLHNNTRTRLHNMDGDNMWNCKEIPQCWSFNGSWCYMEDVNV